MTSGRRALICTLSLLTAAAMTGAERARAQQQPQPPATSDPLDAPSPRREMPAIRDEAQRREYLRKFLDQSMAAFEQAMQAQGARLESRHFAMYAHWSLMLGQDPAKAEAALKRLLSLQDNNPNSRTYGEFAAAEGAGAVAPGESAVTEYTVLSMVQAMLFYGEKLSPEVRELMTERLTAALKAIQRADRRPDLTNVFLMNAIDELLLGELLRDQKAIQQGIAKLVELHGIMRSRGIQEYNSSNQTATQLACLLVGNNYSRQPEARRLIDPMMKFLWSTVAANVVPGRGSLGGPQARTTDFIFGIGTIDSFTFLEGLRDGPPYVAPFSDGLRALVNVMEGGYRPDESIRALARGERLIRQRWGPMPGMDRYFHITPDYAIGSSSASASFYDRKLVAEFTSPRLIPAIWVVPDPFDAPWGQIRDKKTNQLRHPQHYVEHIAAVQEKNALLAVMNLRQDVRGKLVPSVATNVMFPASVDEVLLDGQRLPMDKPFELMVSTDSTVIVREGTGAVAFRLFHIDGLDGQRPVMQLKWDANQWGSARLVGYHYTAPPGARRPPAEQNIRAGVFMLADRVAGADDLQQFIQRVQATKIEHTGGPTDPTWSAKLTDGERVLEAGLNLSTGAIVTRRVNGQEYQPVVFRVNDRDLVAEYLGY